MSVSAAWPPAVRLDAGLGLERKMNKAGVGAGTACPCAPWLQASLTVLPALALQDSRIPSSKRPRRIPVRNAAPTAQSCLYLSLVTEQICLGPGAGGQPDC